MPDVPDEDGDLGLDLDSSEPAAPFPLQPASVSPTTLGPPGAHAEAVVTSSVAASTLSFVARMSTSPTMDAARPSPRSPFSRALGSSVHMPALSLHLPPPSSPKLGYAPNPDSVKTTL